MSPSVRSGEVAEVSSQLADALSHRDLDGVETAAGALDELAAASEAEKSAAHGLGLRALMTAARDASEHSERGAVHREFGRELGR